MAADKLKYSIGNSASTTLSVAISNSDTSGTLTSDTNFSAKSGEGMVLLDESQATEEVAYSTGKTGAVIAIPLANRGLEGGSPQPHTIGSSVKGTLTAGMWNDLIDSVCNVLVKTTGVVDTTKVVDLSTAQTLTNKIINGSNNTVTNVGVPESGWQAAGETWTYASADSPTFTFTIAGVDKTSKYSAGMRIKITQVTGGTKYFIITKVAFSTDTTVTVYGGTDYTLNNETISSPFYSTQKAPQGFPLSPTKWTVEVTDTTDAAQATPAQNTWYNLASITISVPIGEWRTEYFSQLSINDSSSTPVTARAQSTLSTANNSESDADFTTAVDINVTGSGSTAVTVGSNLYKSKILSLTSKTSYYMNARTTLAGMDSLDFRGDLAKTIVRAICAYL